VHLVGFIIKKIWEIGASGWFYYKEKFGKLVHLVGFIIKKNLGNWCIWLVSL